MSEFWNLCCGNNAVQQYLLNGTFVLPAGHCEYSVALGIFPSSVHGGLNVKKQQLFWALYQLCRTVCMFYHLVCEQAMLLTAGFLLQQHWVPWHLLPSVLHQLSLWALHELMLTSHFMNVSDLIVTGLILKVSEAACVLLNGTFVVCTEQLEHALHIITVYLGWNTETVQLSEWVVNQEVNGFSLFASVYPWINILPFMV